MFTVQSTIDPADLTRLAQSFRLTAKESDLALTRAINDVAKTGRSQIRKKYKAYVTLPVKSIDRRVQIDKRATKSNPVATLTVEKGGSSRSRPSVLSYGGKPKNPPKPGRTKTGRVRKRKPFTWRVLKTDPPRTIPGVFVAKTRRGVVQAFRRTGPNRYPLISPKGPSLSAVWQKHEEKFSGPILTDLRERLASRIQGQMRRIHDGKFKKKG